MVSSGDGYVSREDGRTQLRTCFTRRRRRGSTSPPLTCIEVNPGPRKLGRKVAKAGGKHGKKRRKKLNGEEKGEIKLGIKMNLPNKQLARMLGLDPKTIRLWKQRYLETKSLERKTGSGRPRKLTYVETRLLVLRCKRNRRMTAEDLTKQHQQEGGEPVSVWTVRRTLMAAGLYGRVAAKKPLLTAWHRKKRLEWARKYKHWSVDDWKRVVWSDESPLKTFAKFGRVMVRRFINERYKSSLVVPTVKHSKTCMVWGCFSSHGTGPLYRIHGKMRKEQYKQICIKHFVPHLRKLSRDYPDMCPFYLQQDNDPKHTAKVVQKYLENKSAQEDLPFRILDWPSQSPDLNPIENLWAIVKAELAKRNLSYSSEEALFLEAQNIWDNIGADALANLIASMPNRIKMVIKNKGGPTSY